MALSNLFGWKKKEETEVSAACGTACGAADKPEGSNRPVDDCSERTEAERRQVTYEEIKKNHKEE